MDEDDGKGRSGRGRRPVVGRRQRRTPPTRPLPDGNGQEMDATESHGRGDSPSPAGLRVTGGSSVDDRATLRRFWSLAGDRGAPERAG